MKSRVLYVRIASQNLLSSMRLPSSHSQWGPCAWIMAHEWRQMIQNPECQHPYGNSYFLPVNHSYAAFPFPCMSERHSTCLYPMKILMRSIILIKWSATPADSHSAWKIKQPHITRKLCPHTSLHAGFFLNTALGVGQDWWGMQLNRSGNNRAAVMAVLEDANSRHTCVKSENVKNHNTLLGRPAFGVSCSNNVFWRLSRLEQINQFSPLNHSRDLFLTHYSLKNVS